MERRGFLTKLTLAAIALGSVAAIPGCSGFWNAPTDSGGGSDGGGGSSTNPASGIFYVLDQKSNQLAGFSFAAKSTAPTAVSGSPYTLPAIAFSLAMTPDGGTLYVGSASGIFVYTIDSTTGSLTLANSGTPISADPAYAMAVDPSGAWLLEVPSGGGVLSAIPLGDNGLLDTSRDTVSKALPATSVTGIAVSPSGGSASYAFVAMGTGGTAIVPFAAGNTAPFGTVARIGIKNSLGGDNAVAVSPDNSLLYIGETAALSATQSGGLRVFTIGATQISEISGSPFATGGVGPSSILPTASAVYVSNSKVSGKTTGNITGYTVATAG